MTTAAQRTGSKWRKERKGKPWAPGRQTRVNGKRQRNRTRKRTTADEDGRKPDRAQGPETERLGWKGKKREYKKKSNQKRIKSRQKQL